MKKLFAMTIINLWLLPGCASIVTGTNQSLGINTEPEIGANCALSNDKGTWYVPSTPASVTVNRSYSDLNIVCNKNEKSGAIKVKSQTKGMAFGNLIAGGIIGGAVDMGTGAAYDYPAMIHVPLK